MVWRLWWVFVFLGLPVEAYIETVIVSGCESCKLHLTCRHLTSIIAILEADFTPELINETALNDSVLFVPTPTAFPPFHPRQALNQRCSGVNHCSFILNEDCPGADAWGSGNLTIKYVCISASSFLSVSTTICYKRRTHFPIYNPDYGLHRTEDRIRKFCNSEIVLPDAADSEISEGFIHNPGYPRFYASEGECRWKIKAPAEQRIKIKVLDIAMTADRAMSSKGCTDHLQFIDSGQIVRTTCEPQEPPLEVISDTDSLELVLASTHSLMPLRGVFVYYTAVGCPTPDAPEDGYLVYRNESVAEFRCCIDRFFEDDGLKTKVVTCLGSKWDVELPLSNCTKNPKYLVLPEEIRKPQIELEMTSDVLAPALLIAALFLINFIILFYIYKIKQKHAMEFADEELGTLPLSNNDKASP